MIEKTEEKNKAIILRKQGLSYREILEKVSVAKSTLSLWLGKVGLSKPQKQRLTEKRLIAARKGGEVKQTQRILRSEKIREQARKEINKISDRELWLMGIMLYWAEGSKEKKEHPGSGAQFTNGDPEMVKLFLKWLSECCGIEKREIILEIYIHDNHKDNLTRAIRFWSSVTQFPQSHFKRIYFKKDKPKTNRMNTGKGYYGILRIVVRSSSTLNRRIAGWIEGVVHRMNY